MGYFVLVHNSFDVDDFYCYGASTDAEAIQIAENMGADGFLYGIDPLH